MSAPANSPLSSAILQLLFETGALQEVTALACRICGRGITFDKDSLVASTVALSATSVPLDLPPANVRTNRTKDDLAMWCARAESAAETALRLAPSAHGFAEKLRRQQEQPRRPITLAGSDACAVAALLAVLADKASTFLAAITVTYDVNAGDAGGVTASGEAAIVWQAETSIDKSVGQFCRVLDKLAFHDSDSKVEVVGSAHDATGSYENARYALAVQLMLLGVVLRGSAVCLRPVDLHVTAAAGGSQESPPVEYPVVLSMTGPWPWGDRVRSKVGQDERDELVLKLIDGDGEMADNITCLDLGTSDAIQEKKEQHIFCIGQTGVGKSSLCNILVGEEAFRVDHTKVCL
jgi:hypothetical protein